MLRKVCKGRAPEDKQKNDVSQTERDLASEGNHVKTNMPYMADLICEGV